MAEQLILNADPSQIPNARGALAIIRGHFLWLFVLLSISCMNLVCVALAILLHFAFDKFINWVIADAYSRVREILTGASVAAFGVISMVLLWEMVWTFIKFRTPAHSARAVLSQPLSPNAQIPAAVPMIPHLKLEVFVVRFVLTRLARLIATLFPAVLAQAGKSYLSLLILGVIALACTQLYNSSASQNDRTYVAFIMLLSFVWTTKAIIVSFKKLGALDTQTDPISAEPAK